MGVDRTVEKEVAPNLWNMLRMPSVSESTFFQNYRCTIAILFWLFYLTIFFILFSMVRIVCMCGCVFSLFFPLPLTWWPMGKAQYNTHSAELKFSNIWSRLFSRSHRFKTPKKEWMWCDCVCNVNQGWMHVLSKTPIPSVTYQVQWLHSDWTVTV